MDIVDTFESFAAAFEAAFQDDDWSRLRPYLAEDATYLNVGGPDPISKGPEAIVEYLQSDTSNTDRRFDTRTLEEITAPQVTGNRLNRKWRCTYTFKDTPALVVEGEARYVIDGGLIRSIEQEPTVSSVKEIERWMGKYGGRLHA
jgi:ketosteroid isomerase-like protein